MNLDAMKETWAAQDREIEATQPITRQMLRSAVLSPARNALGRLKLLLGLDLAVNLALAVALGSYNAGHVAEPRFLVPGVVLHIAVILEVIVSGYRLANLVTVDFGAPVVAIQRALGQAEAHATRTTFWILVAAPLLWIPMLIVGLKGVFGVDAFAYVDHGWLATNVLFGLVVIATALWASRRYADRLTDSPRLQQLAKTLAGHNLAVATGYLDDLRSFEK